MAVRFHYIPTRRAQSKATLSGLRTFVAKKALYMVVAKTEWLDLVLEEVHFGLYIFFAWVLRRVHDEFY